MNKEKIKNRIKATLEELTDQELLDLTDININKGGIPYLAVCEVRKRGLRKFTSKTVTS
tara:strand:+ start:241 stop:417 length:177 start_codon:yes stop_codon:yes gene_type:complete